MVPDNFNWKMCSKKYGITEKRFYYILSFIRKYNEFKKDYEECYSSFRITSYDILPKRRYVDSHIEINAIRASYIKSRIDLIESTARSTTSLTVLRLTVIKNTLKNVGGIIFA